MSTSVPTRAQAERGAIASGLPPHVPIRILVCVKMLRVCLLVLATVADAISYCTISGLSCPPAHQDADSAHIYTSLTGTVWVNGGTTADGRPWFRNTDVAGGIQYLYYSPRNDGFFLTASAPNLALTDPWTTDNNQVRLSSGGNRSPEGTWNSAALYCGHDTGAAADGCGASPRDDGRFFYWCNN